MYTAVRTVETVVDMTVVGNEVEVWAMYIPWVDSCDSWKEESR